ncbi:hypothetical protein ACFLTN_04955 [Chloroflexota bacterium]
MKKEAIRYLIPFTVLPLLTLSLVVACAQPNAILLPTLPEPSPTPPPAVSDNQTPEEPPPVSEAKDEEVWYTTGTFSGTGNDTIPSFHIYGTEWRITWTIDAESPETANFELLIYCEDAPYAIWQTVYNSSGSSGEANYILFPGDRRDFFIKVTAKNLRQWSIIVEDNASAATSYPVRITYIRYKGTVHPTDPEQCICYERVEPDEYVVIKNLGECYVDVTGWVLKNMNKLYPSFTFPSCVMIPGGIIRVYTDEVHSETGGYRFCYASGTGYVFIEPTGGLSFSYGPGDIWSNDNPDIAVLYDAEGNEVSRKSYAIPVKLNEASSE